MALIRGHAIPPASLGELDVNRHLLISCSESVEHDPRHDAQFDERTRAIAAV